MSGKTGYVPDRGDVVVFEFSPQAGREQMGRRPALVVSPASYNRLFGLACVCPITNQRKGLPFEVPLPAGGEITGVVLADQYKNLDWRARKAKFVEAVDEGVVDDVVRMHLPLIDPHNVFTAGPEETEE